MQKFDLCIIGCGPGGFAAAMRALNFGKRVCLLETGSIGGSWIFNGALTSKTMWELSRDYSIAAKVDRGYRSGSLTVDYNEVRNTIIQAAKEKQYQLLSQIESLSKPAADGGALTFIRGKGTFKTNKIIEVEDKNGVSEIFAEAAIISTGSKPRAYNGIPFDHERIISSDDILNLRKFPKRMMIIGGGIIGCEFATIFSYFRQTKVYLLDRQSRIIPFEDPDLSELISRNLEDQNVTIYHNAILRDIRKNPDSLEVVIDYEDGHSKVVEVDIAFISIGRTPNTGDLNLKGAGISVSDGGYLRSNNNCRIKDNIYAVGDVTGRSALVNVAETEGRYAVKAIYERNEYPLNYQNMSTIMFFRPEVAAVGLNEQLCRTKKIPYRVAYVSLAMVNRAIAMRNTNGFVKLLVTREEDPKILGMRAAGPHAADLIILIALAMDQQKRLNDLMRTIHPHPSMSEVLQECMRMLVGKSMYKPEVFPEYMQIREWEPPPEEKRIRNYEL